MENAEVSKIIDGLSRLKTLEELKLVNEYLGLRWKQIQSWQAAKFQIGQMVQFKSSKTGAIVKARVMKINQKTVKVEAENGSIWRVSPSMLSAVAF